MDVEVFSQRLGGIKAAGGGDFLPVPEIELCSIEERIGTKLPSAYRNLLAQYGAFTFRGRSENNPFIYFSSKTPLPDYIADEGSALIDFFYGSTQKRGPLGLLEQLNYYQDRIPSSLLPIADDGGAGQICLGIQGSDRGRIYYWDREGEPLDADAYFEEFGESIPEGYNRQNLYLIADSLEEFFTQLTLAPESD